MRATIINAIDEAVSNGARIHKACEVINICVRRLRRWKNKSHDGRTGGYRANSQKLTDKEKALIIENFSGDNSELPVRVAHAKLMDEGVYIASPATCIRVLSEQKPNKEASIKSPIVRVRPELRATVPCKVWCWDISWLPSSTRGKYFYLYLIIDMFSRFVIDWDVYTTEDGVLARQLFSRAFQTHDVDEENLLVVHADNGQTMRSTTLNELFNRLSVQASHSRPHTSNDNAFAESIFSTLKGRVLYPECFETLSGAKLFMEKFVEWYNFEHKHTGLDYLSPYEVHYSKYKSILENRNQILDNHRREHPSRYGQKTKSYRIPEVVELKHRVTLKTTG